jgi:hypothetical protein
MLRSNSSLGATEATALNYAPQPDALFSAPPGYKRGALPGASPFGQR